MSVANVSQHLQVLTAGPTGGGGARGHTGRIIGLADRHVLELWLTLRSVAEERLADIGQLRRDVDVYDEDVAHTAG